MKSPEHPSPASFAPISGAAGGGGGCDGGGYSPPGPPIAASADAGGDGRSVSSDAASDRGSGRGGSGRVLLAECLRLLAALPEAAAAAPSFRRHWPAISAATTRLSASLSDPTFPTTTSSSTSLLLSIFQTLNLTLALASSSTPCLGKLRTNSDLAAAASSLSQLAADADLLLLSPSSAAGDGDSIQDLTSRLRVGGAASRLAALESLVSLLASADVAAFAVADVVASAAAAVCPLLSSATSRHLAASALAALLAAADSDTIARLAAADADVITLLIRLLESNTSASAAENACVALEALTRGSRDAAVAAASRGGVAALLDVCRGGTPAAQAAAAAVLKNLAAFPELTTGFREEDALPVLVALVSSATPRAQELALGCLRNLTTGGDYDGDEGESIKITAFQEGALYCVKDFLDSGRGDDKSLEPAIGLVRNLAQFRYIAEIAVSAGFLPHVVTALESARSGTRAEAARAIAELGGNGKVRKGIVDAMPRLIRMLESKGAEEREAAARALAALVTVQGYRRLFKKNESGIVNVVQLIDPHVRDIDKKFPVSVLLSISQSRRCRKQMVAAGACGFLQGLLAAEVDGAKKLLERLGKGKILGVFPRG